MRFYYNLVWPVHILENEKRQSFNGSLNYYTILQLELFCHRNRKAGNSLQSIWASQFGLPENQLWICSLSRTEPICLEAYVWEWKWNFYTIPPLIFCLCDYSLSVTLCFCVYCFGVSHSGLRRVGKFCLFVLSHFECSVWEWK